MTKPEEGLSHNQISVAAILGDNQPHLPVYVDKIRSNEQISHDQKGLADKYLTRTAAIKNKNSSKQPQ